MSHDLAELVMCLCGCAKDALGMQMTTAFLFLHISLSDLDILTKEHFNDSH